MKRWLIRIFLILLVLFAVIAFWMYTHTWDRFPGYEVDVSIAPRQPKTLQIGFAKRSITPEITETWTDVNGDAVFNPDDGDTYQDVNGNGQFDAVWMAGFHQGRAANGIHDSIWARVMVIDDGQTRMAIASIDAIGFGHDDVIRVRKKISPASAITYATIHSTHTHETPDLIGLWGKGGFASGVNPAYKQLVIDRTAEAIDAAVSQMRPAFLRIGRDLEGAIPLVNDSRKPFVLDPGIRILQAIDTASSETLGTLFCWADHPEDLWSKNLLISSDFPHYVREGMEKGVAVGDSVFMEGVGGMCVYVNGAIGGLMTTDPETGITALDQDTSYFAPSFAKAEAHGKRLAMLGLSALHEPDTMITQASLGIRAKSLHLPLDNLLFRLAAGLGILDRGMPEWMHLRTELSAWTLGPIGCLQVPGEIYPEIVNGGIEAPTGQDFVSAPLETPPLRPQIPGRFKLVFGLANDLIGYIIPYSEWDEEAPHIYDLPDSPYGEINSLGPQTAPIIYRESVEVLEAVTRKEGTD
ncbi:MAG: hypothetical protein AAF206_07520 [Bacteroidota bacterium]